MIEALIIANSNAIHPGVLQRFAICYLIIACLHLNSLLNINNEPKFLKLNLFYRFYLADIYPFFFEWLVMFAMIGIYLFFTLLFNYDDNCQKGYQGKIAKWTLKQTFEVRSVSHPKFSSSL